MRTHTRSPQAQCAQALRAELARIWPTVAFRVRSGSFVGGTIVTVAWNLGPPVPHVERVTRKYQVEPSAPFVRTQRRIPDPLLETACRAYAALLGEPVPDGADIWNHRITRRDEYITRLVYHVMDGCDFTRPTSPRRGSEADDLLLALRHASVTPSPATDRTRQTP